MPKPDKPPKKKARLAAIENRLVEVQELLHELDRKLDAHISGHVHAPHTAEPEHEGEAPHPTHVELNERLARLETKLDTLIAGLAEVEAGPALRGDSENPGHEDEPLES